jgi:hypothetical protein
MLTVRGLAMESVKFRATFAPHICAYEQRLVVGCIIAMVTGGKIIRPYWCVAARKHKSPGDWHLKVKQTSYITIMTHQWLSLSE